MDCKNSILEVQIVHECLHLSSLYVLVGIHNNYDIIPFVWSDCIRSARSSSSNFLGSLSGGMCNLCCSYVVVHPPDEDRHGMYTDIKVVWILFSSSQRIYAHRSSFLESMPDSLDLEDSIVLVIIAVPPGFLGDVMSCSLLLKPNTDLIPWL